MAAPGGGGLMGAGDNSGGGGQRLEGDLWLHGDLTA